VNVIDMTPSVVLVLAIGVLFAAGVYLLLERSLTRVLLGFILMGNGANLLFLVAGGRAGGAPLIGTTPEDEMSDPLVQAMVLTAIVITLGITAFVLAMAYRSWQLHGHDEVQDDLEDRRIAAGERPEGSMEEDTAGSDDGEDPGSAAASTEPAEALPTIGSEGVAR
jgi:multicomponent Na+:H+ antiporter subunit C